MNVADYNTRLERRTVASLAVLSRVTLAALLAFAVWLPLHYSPYGVMPLDESIVFDGGWRILSGQRPFVDFFAPAGLVPSAIQAVFFAIFGVSWFAYALHAAIFNALFAWMAWRIMRLLGAGPVASLIVAFASAVVFYPPFGLPYLEQHSFFFSLACVWAAILVVTDAPSRRTAMLAAPLLGALAFLSKPIPALFIVPPALLVIAGMALVRRRDRLLVAASLVVPIALAIGYLAASGSRLNDVVYYAFTLPAQTAEGRDLWSRMAAVGRGWFELMPGFGFPLSAVLILAAVAMLAARWLFSPNTVRSQPSWNGQLGDGRTRTGWVEAGPTAAGGLSLGLLIVTILFVALTDNHVANGVPLLPLIVGLAWRSADLALERLWGRPGRGRLPRVCLATIVLVLGGFSLWRFDRTINLGRMVHEGQFNWRLPRWRLDGSLGFMVLTRESSLFDYRDVQRYIEQRRENFFLFRDSSFLYGATGHPSIFPALWMHPGLTIPPWDSWEFYQFESKLLRDMADAGVRYVIQEGSQTRMHVRLTDFPRVWRKVEGCPVATAGAWTIREICR